MMASGSAFQTNGLGSWLWVSTKRLMAVCSATSEWKTPRWSRRLVSLAKKVSTALSQEHEVGREVKDPARMAGEPLAHLGLLVGAVVVEHDVDQLAGRHRRARSR